MKVRKVTDVPRTSERVEVVSNVLKNVSTNAQSSGMTQFLDNAQPMSTKWYNINRDASYIGLGYKDTAGPYEGGIKYNVIHNYIVYGYVDERPVDVETGDQLDPHYNIGTLTFIHLPNTLTPLPGDRVSLEVENHRILYKVISATPTNFNNKPFIRTELTKCDIHSHDYYEEDFRKDGLLVDTLEYVSANLGTQYSPFMASSTIDAIEKLEAYKKEINEQFNEYFYDEYKNIYVSAYDDMKSGFISYTPLLVELQMEFRTLWTYDVNTILTHETITTRRFKYMYKKNPLRRFLNRMPGAWDALKENGIEFSGYEYSNNIRDPLFRIESYLNDGGKYYIYDEYHGDGILYDDEGKALLIVNTKQVARIPESLYELFQKYTDDTIETDYLIEFLEEYDFGMCFVSMLMAFTVMTIVDKVIAKNKSLNVNKGILT